MRILLAIEDSDLRLSIELMLSQEPSVRVVGVASQAEGLLALLDSARSELVILDWDLPGQPVTELMSHLQNHIPKIHFIMLGRDPALKETVLQAGADAFVVKGDPPEKLLAAFRLSRSWLKTRTTKSSATEE